MEALLVFAVVSNDIEAAGHRNEKLVTLFEGVASAISATRNVVQVKDSFDLEGDVAIGFEEGKIAARIVDFRQFDDAALV